MRLKRIDLSKYKQDYRHIICALITFISVASAALFPNCLPRLLESLRDVITSLLYYIVEIVVFENNFVSPTVTELQSWQLVSEIWEPVKFLPASLEEYFDFWELYCKALFNSYNFSRYLNFLGDFIFNGSRILLLIFSLLMIFGVQLEGYKNKHCMVRGKKSPELIKFERFLFNKIYPGFSWCKSFLRFLRENDGYYKFWIFIWCLYFNVFSIFCEFFAFYFYFAVSFDFLSIYGQLLKLQTDLTPMIRFIPGFGWFCIFMVIYNYVCRSMAFNRLYYSERANRAVLRDRGIVSVVYGKMGVGKTQLITSMALSAEIEQYDQAFDIMLELYMHFPNFPWEYFRDELRHQIELRNIVDIPSCREWVRYNRAFFDRVIELNMSSKAYQSRLGRYAYLKDHTFGYDYTHYPVMYNNELELRHLFDDLEDYACAYLIFTVKTTLLFSNYSIRVDSILHDLGNMPVRDNDFFNRSPEYQEAYSRHAHIIDMDMLRLGKKFIEDNPKARRLSYGVFVITEIDKERKNTIELKETKIKTDEVNQKNDLFNACLMMCRHAAVVHNKVFIRIICDLQRPESWGAGGRELGEVIYISDKDELCPVLPFFSPYWLFQGVFEWIKEKWDSFYCSYIQNRADGTLFVYLCKNLVSLISNHYDKINGLFGMQTLYLEIQDGKLDGEVKQEKWRLLSKKDRSNRYKTACLESVFDSYEPNFMHVDDFVSYANELASQEELALQNSYFQDDIKKVKKS